MQQQIRDEATRITHRLTASYTKDEERPSLWFTYHVYHKAPDWIGPVVCDALKIPYVIAEASFAPKQQNGRWSMGHEQCRRSIRSADAVVSLNRQDDPCLREIMNSACTLIELKPFMALDDIGQDDVDRTSIARKWGIPADRPWLVCVAMMREGDKLASYAELAQALQLLEGEDWHLLIVGDGPARRQVSKLFEPLAARTTNTGLLCRKEICTILSVCDLYVWPAVNEAYGMALLEAQSCGLPVVASAVGGVPQIVEHEDTGLLAPPGDPRTLSRYICRLIRDPEARREMGARARSRCRSEHDIRRATKILAGLIQGLTASGVRRS